MGTIYVKTVQEMNTQNRLFNRRVKSAQVRTLIRLGNINIQKSQQIIKKGLIPYSGGGALFSSINLKSPSSTKVIVYATDYGTGENPEIEKGLKESEFRYFSQYPKLKGWVSEKWDSMPKKGIWVGGTKEDGTPSSPEGIPHPFGLHYFELGGLEAKKKADKITTQELGKIS